MCFTLLDSQTGSAQSPEGARSLACSGSKLWIFRGEKELKVYFHTETSDPRIAAILNILSDWTECTGIRFTPTELLHDSDIRVAFGQYEKPSEAVFVKKKTHPAALGSGAGGSVGSGAMAGAVFGGASGAGLGAAVGGASWLVGQAVGAAVAGGLCVEELECIQPPPTNIVCPAGCWSFVGTDAKRHPDEPTMSFGFAEFQEPNVSCLNREQWEIFKGTVLHEFGHALGFEHENPHGVPLDEQAVLNKYSKYPNCWTERQIRFNVLEPAGRLCQFDAKPDPDSIMSYAVALDELTAAGQQDLLPDGRNRWVHGARSKLSAMDKIMARKRYT